MKIIIALIITLFYIFLVSQLFEYTVNEASNTILTLAGIVVFIFISYFYFRYIIKTLKHFIK